MVLNKNIKILFKYYFITIINKEEYSRIFNITS